ncbi:nucleoside/nucleotide kinase family protein [Spirilliplanes yamanashiensis]|uniref:Nucleoside/nucleotide kinase family protein n=1 Tax=Spirilliplanes yamanashiensis TaxID=42233 RepID=A0A8J3YAB5_9ACTN|nr:nucleoside/nucleotide kinase family protein [Spirilliplanes yamanashiensis]MDP9817619.1 pantothenate kinase [Spirilliplanes yamanashiensis]GIJ04429.1 nucleoside/nucleotide kinase family protein [Spirilliplanes yamanashiensis]
MTGFADLVARARGLADGGRRAVLGVTGAPGAGKSTLAEKLVEALAPHPPAGLVPGQWVAHVPGDGYHLADVELDRLGRRARKGAPDTFDPLGYAALLRRLHDDADELIYAPGFERVIEQPIAASIPVPRAARLIVTEANYLLLPDPAWRQVRAALTEVWYVELDDAERLRRLVGRHERFGKDRDAAVAWATGTDQHNADLVGATRDAADLIVDAAVLPRPDSAVV